MRAAGVELIEHVANLARDGLRRSRSSTPAHYRAAAARSRARIASGRVALVVLVDYGGFNMKVAAAATAAGVPVLYYITPQVWAWRARRLAELARTVTRAAVILPFEEALLRENGIDATFVGHPLLDRALNDADRAEARRTIGVAATKRGCSRSFPGSRAQEIARHLDAVRRDGARASAARSGARGGGERRAARADPCGRAVRIRIVHGASFTCCARPTPRCARAARRRSRPRSHSVRWSSRIARIGSRTRSRAEW